MQASGWLQFALYFVALVLITKPMGLYLLQVLDANGRTWLDPVVRPLERVTYRLMGVDSSKEHKLNPTGCFHIDPRIFPAESLPRADKRRVATR